jgi:hypothetical protein
MTSFQKMFGGRKRGSEVWKYFKYDEQMRKCTCLVAKADGRLCSSLLATKNPTNLKNHLKSHHSTQYDEISALEAEETEAKKKRAADGREDGIKPMGSGKFI